MNIEGASQDEIDRVQGLIKERYAGSGGRRIIFLNGEQLDAKSFNSPGARDMDYVNGREQMLKFASAVYQTNTGVLGLTDADSYASFYAKLKQFHQNCLRPRAKDLADALTKHLARKYYPRDRLCIEIDLPKIDDQDALQKIIKTASENNAIHVNEIRGMFGWEPWEDGDVIPKAYEAAQMKQFEPSPNAMPEVPGGGKGKDFPGHESVTHPAGLVAPPEQAQTAISGPGGAPVPNKERLEAAIVLASERGDWQTVRELRELGVTLSGVKDTLASAAGEANPTPGAADTGATQDSSQGGETGESATGAPPEANPDGEGSLGERPDRVQKSMDPEKFPQGDPAPYGYCPQCRSKGVACERRKNGNATCENGHQYPMAKAKYASTQVELTGSVAEKLLAMANSIPDGDLGEDGRETDPHVTIKYGLHADSPLPVAHVVTGYGPVTVRVGKLSAFFGENTNRDYDVIFAEIYSPDLQELNKRLSELPHTDTWPSYNPHATVAYVKAGLAKKYLAMFGVVDETVKIETIVFGSADRQESVIPLTIVTGSVRMKSMSAFADGSGGTLVAPATCGATRPKKRKRSKAKKRAIRDYAAEVRREVLKSMGG